MTCLAHGLHNFAEAIRKKWNVFSQFMEYFFEFLETAKGRQSYKTQTNLPLPPTPVLSRWGTWIKAAVFFVQNWSRISEFILTNNLEKLDKLAFSTQIEEDANIILSFSFLPESILAIEANDLPVLAQIKIIQQVRNKIYDDDLIKKFDNINETNPGYVFFKDYSSLRPQYKHLHYAPLTTCDVERSFSGLKALLSDQRNFDVPNLSNHL